MNRVQTQAISKVRNQGIDLLRILSMLMVIILHILGAGDLLKNIEPFSPSYIAALLMRICSYCAVNCYGLISGYVGIYSKYKYTNIILLWLQVFIYSFTGTLISFVLNIGEGGGLRLLHSLFPVSNVLFWYFTAYFGMFFFIPIINHIVNSLNKQQAKLLLLILFVLFSVIPTLAMKDTFVTEDGYSVLWLVLLYYCGACIRKFDLFADVKTIRFILIYALSVLLTLAVKLFMKAGIISILENFFTENSFISYTSPTVIFCALSLLMLFSRLKIKAKPIVKVISMLSPLAFGVYIIHMVEFVQIMIFGSGIFIRFANYPPVVLICAVILSAIIIFIGCAAVDGIRHYLFKKLRLKERLERLENKYIGYLWKFPSPKE